MHKRLSQKQQGTFNNTDIRKTKQKIPVQGKIVLYKKIITSYLLQGLKYFLNDDIPTSIE